MDSDSFSLDFLMRSLSVEVKWGTNQKPVVWVFDKRMGEDIQLVDESQILDVLDMYKREKHLKLLVAVFDKDTCDQYDALVLEPLCVVPPEPSTIPSECFPPPAQEGQATFESKVAGCEEPAGEEADEAEPDVFDSGEEYVGVDDEGMYGHPSAPTTGADTAQLG